MKINNVDEQNIKEIRDFLEKNSAVYDFYKPSTFKLNRGQENRFYEVDYVSSQSFPIAYPKYNIDGVDKNYFFNLSYKAEQNNSFKLWIKDFEWNNFNKKEILKSYILHAINKTPNKFYARDCYVDEIPAKEARAFENIHCFYGKRGASLNLGLRLKKSKGGLPKKSLLMLYTFGKNFFGKNKNTIEVIRVGTVKYSYVTGGSSKLLKHFINNYKTINIGKHQINVKELKFYSDYDHNLGGSMNSLGFKFQGYSKGGFMNYWIEEKKVKHRQPMQHKWVMDQMRQGKVLAIPNAGTKVYTLRVD